MTSEIEAISPQALEDFANHIWLNWGPLRNLNESLDEAEKSVVSARQDLHRVIVTLDSRPTATGG